jgi:hypothetical protein
MFAEDRDSKIRLLSEESRDDGMLGREREGGVFGRLNSTRKTKEKILARPSLETLKLLPRSKG